MYSFGFCLSEKFFLSPSILSANFAGQSILGCRFFPFRTLSISCHSFLAYKVSVDKSDDILMGGFTCNYLFFSCCLQNSHFNFCHFNYNMSYCGSGQVHLVWDPLFLLYLDIFFLPGSLLCIDWHTFYIIPQISCVTFFVFHLSFCLLFWLCNFYYSVFEIIIFVHYLVCFLYHKMSFCLFL